MTDLDVVKHTPNVSGWEVLEEQEDGRAVRKLVRTFHFDSFSEVFAFVRRAGELIEKEQHHPRFTVEADRVSFVTWTHAVRGLHENDFILAAKLNELSRKHDD